MFPSPISNLRSSWKWRISLGLLLLATVPALLGVVLAWDVTQTNTGTFIWWGPTSQTYTNRVDMGASSTGAITGLPIGSTQYIANTVYWLSNGIESDFSPELVYVVPDPAAPKKTNLVVRLDKADTLGGAGWSNLFSLVVTNPAQQGFYRLVITNQVQ